ncbi:MAG: lactate utilization protein [Candidatus Limivivens sp.]|nr:lactate utilization protein [Candidatus Limivivens sp.]
MTPKQSFYEAEAMTIIKHLEKRGMEGYYCPTSAEAVEKALSFMEKGATVSWGGSMTLTECGMMDALREADLLLIDRDSAKNSKERMALLRQAFSADYFLMSSNAITKDGQLVNIDGTGNRAAALVFGPEHVILLVGMNKVAKNVEEAISRVHETAAPQNALRLNLKTPCSVTGSCADCTSADCICAHTVITRFNRTPGRIKVILIGESLGY